MPHTVYGDATALRRFDVVGAPQLVLVPAVFECQECEDVRQAISRWQERTDQQRDDSENEGQVHIVNIGWLPPKR